MESKKASGDKKYEFPSDYYVVDVGMHVGSDSEYYARRGFNVVAFEANPVLADSGKARFAELGLPVEVRNQAIYDGSEDHIIFHVNNSNTQWSSLKRDLAIRGDGLCQDVRVPTGNLANELRDIQDRIHMVKIDIEGFDYVALSQIAQLQVRPPYISVENGGKYFFRLFAEMGYKRFKYANQRYTAAAGVRRNSPHGNWIDHKFHMHSSGPFGEDVVGSWMSLDEAEKVSEAIDLGRAAAGSLWADTIGWFDMHARLQD